MLRKLITAATAALIIGGGAAATLAASAGAAAAQTTVTAHTQITGDADSGYNGYWALDTISRTASLTLGSEVLPVYCNAIAVHCYSYTGTISDTGTFTTDTAATSPGAKDVPINGVQQGTITGGSPIQFYASTPDPNPGLVPAQVNMGGCQTGCTGFNSTEQWVEYFFPAGTVFSTNVAAGNTLTTWSWTYKDTATCETWTDAYNVPEAQSGDITGTGLCAYPAPVNLHQTVYPTSASLAWGDTAANANTLRYHVGVWNRYTHQIMPGTATVTGGHDRATGLSPSTAYCWDVNAVGDSTHLSSAESAVVCFTTKP